MKRLSKLLYLALFIPLPLLAQHAQGEDPLGRPYKPVVGVLKTEAAPGIQPKLVELTTISFLNGLKNVGGAFPPYEVVNKDKLSDAVGLLKIGYKASDPRLIGFREDLVGAQYLLRLDINSFEMGVDEDSIYDEKNKFVRVDRHKVASTNMTVRLVDVATSKVLMFNNLDASGTTKGLTLSKTLSDSAQAVTQMYNQVRAYANGMIHNYVAGAATITGIHKESKGKAEEVILNNAPVIFPNRETGLNVYALLKTYTIEGQTFRDAELVGVVNKGKNYQVSIRNFDVQKGEKKIAEHMKAGTTLICVPGSFPLGPFTVSESRTSLALQEFKNTNQVPVKVQRILQDMLSETAASRPLLLDIVDREIYDLIQKERELQQKTLSGATQAGISFGSNYFLNVELLDFTKSSVLKYKTITEEKPVVKPATPATTTAAPASKTEKTQTPEKSGKIPAASPTKSDKTTPTTTASKPAAPEKITKRVPDKFEANANARLNLNLVSVKTGEVVFTNGYNMTGKGAIAYNKDKYDRVRSEEMAFRDMANNVSFLIWKEIQKSLTPKFHLLTVLETGKTGPESVLVSGGKHSGFYEDMEIEVIEVVQEDVDGQKIDRDVVIGELKITDIRPETSVCKVKKGGADLQMKLDKKARIYCRKG